MTRPAWLALDSCSRRPASSRRRSSASSSPARWRWCWAAYSQGQLPLAAGLTAAIAGTIGRFVKASHLDRAEAYLAAKGGKAVFFGRFTATLRVLIPGLAAMASMRYRTFLRVTSAGSATRSLARVRSVSWRPRTRAPRRSSR